MSCFLLWPQFFCTFTASGTARHTGLEIIRGPGRALWQMQRLRRDSGILIVPCNPRQSPIRYLLLPTPPGPGNSLSSGAEKGCKLQTHTHPHPHTEGRTVVRGGFTWRSRDGGPWGSSKNLQGPSRALRERRALLVIGDLYKKKQFISIRVKPCRVWIMSFLEERVSSWSAPFGQMSLAAVYMSLPPMH